MNGTKVEVYWNLHKKCWSIRHAHGKLIAYRPHRNYLEMQDVAWVVQQGGRERVLREGKKNVHAFARGVLKDFCDEELRFYVDDEPKHVTYNPFKHNHFTDRKTGEPVRTSDLAVMGSKTVEGKERPAVWAMGGE